MLQKSKYFFLGVFVASIGLWGLAVTIPNTFSSGDVVSATKMNQNFQALKDAVTALEAEVANLETRLDGLNTKQGMPRAGVAVDRDGSILNSWSTTGGAITSTETATGKYTISFADESIYYSKDLVALTTFDDDKICNAGSVGGSLLVYCQDLDGNFVSTKFSVVLFNDDHDQ